MVLVDDPSGWVSVIFVQHLSSDGGGGGGSVLGAALALGGSILVGLLVGLVGAVNGDLDSDFATLDLLAVHLGDGLLLKLLGGEGDKAEASTLAGLTTGLELLDHEAGNRAQGDLGGRGLVVVEELLELQGHCSLFTVATRKDGVVSAAYLLLGQVVGQVSHHDLGLGGDAVGRGAAFTALARSTSLLSLAIGVSVVGHIGDVLQWLNLVSCGVGGSRSGALGAVLLLALQNKKVSAICLVT